MAQGAALASRASGGDAVIEVEPAAPRRPAGPTVAEGRASGSADALSALVNLGYGQGDAAEAIATVTQDGGEHDTGTLIRLALKRLAPR